MTDAWVSGTFATFDYFHTQCLFSAATILAVSSLLRSSQSEGDHHRYDNAVELLRQLDGTGSCVAKEFCGHVDAMQSSIAAVRSDTSIRSVRLNEHDTSQDAAALSHGTGLTAGMALADPSLRNFLAETDLDIQAFDNSLFDDSHMLYWPQM